MISFRDITCNILSSEDAIAETIEPDGLEVIAPPRVQETLAIPEFSRLGFGPELPENAIQVSIESDWMERMESLMGNRGRFIELTLWSGEMKANPPDLEQMLAKHIALTNATFRSGGSSDAWTRYLMFVFKITAISDEKREEIIPLCLNESNGACVDSLLDPFLSLMNSSGEAFSQLPSNADLPAPWPERETAERCEKCLSAKASAKFAPFLAGMKKRMRKDLARLHDYHTIMLKESALKTAENSGKSPAADDLLKREEMRRKTIEREYHAKVADLKRKYAVSFNIRLAQVARLAIPVSRIGLVLMRRKEKRNIYLDWNCISKKPDAFSCESCGSVLTSCALCDDKLHMLCNACLADCSSCGKSYCRACYPRRCPRCGADRLRR